MESKARLPTVAVDLFCSAGGLSYGMQQSCIAISAGIDADPACSQRFEANTDTRYHEMDAQTITPKFLKPMFPNDGAIKTVTRMNCNTMPVKIGKVIGQCITPHVRNHG